MFMSSFIPDDEAKNGKSLTKESLFESGSLKKLFQALKTDHNYKTIVTPRWKNYLFDFRDKTRINNAIWRSWHIQFINNKMPRFCHFSPPNKPTSSYRTIQVLSLDCHRYGKVPIHYDPTFQPMQEILSQIIKKKTEETLPEGNESYKGPLFADLELLSSWDSLFLDPLPNRVNDSHLTQDNNETNRFDWVSFLQPDLSQLLPNIDIQYWNQNLPTSDPSMMIDPFYSQNQDSSLINLGEINEISLSSIQDNFLSTQITDQQQSEVIVKKRGRPPKNISSTGFPVKKNVRKFPPETSEPIKKFNILPRPTGVFTSQEKTLPEAVKTQDPMKITLSLQTKDKDSFDKIKTLLDPNAYENRHKRRRAYQKILLDELYVALDSSIILSNASKHHKRPPSTAILSSAINHIRSMRNKIASVKFTSNELKIRITQMESDLKDLHSTFPQRGISYCSGISLSQHLETIRANILSNYKYWIFYILFEPLVERLIKDLLTNENQLDWTEIFNGWYNSNFPMDIIRYHIFSQLRSISKFTCILENPQNLQRQALKALQMMQDPTKIEEIPPSVSLLNKKGS